tara:strand:+ start:185 stop:589 length:405 start_codon:yes stop_codon:yes gene_type:complete
MDLSMFRPELAETPELPAAGLSGIRQQNQLVTRKPPIQEASADALTFGESARALAAAEYADKMRAAYGTSRQYDRRNKAVAKARARQNDRQLKNSSSRGVRSRRKLQGITNRRADSAILRNARDVLGMGTDLYR